MSLRFEDFELLGKLDDNGLWETWLARGLKREQGAPPLAFMLRIPQGRASIRELILLHRQVGRAAGIRNRNLIPILSHGKTGDDYTVLRAAFPGQSVGAVSDRHMRQRGETLPVETIVTILVQVADVLASVHSALDDAGAHTPVSHGALTAGSILMDHRGGVRVFDAGLELLSRSVQPEMLAENAWRYYPPEAFRGERDPRTDVYSWGAVAWELLCGQPLFGTPGASDRMRVIATVEPKLASLYNPGVSRELDQLVARSLSKDPNQRFVDGQQLLGMLRQHIQPNYPEVDASTLASMVGRLFDDQKSMWSEALRAVVEADAERATELFKELTRGDGGPGQPFAAAEGRKGDYTEPVSGATFTVDETIPEEGGPSIQLDAAALFGDMDFDLGLDDQDDLRATNPMEGGVGPVSAPARTSPPDQTGPTQDLLPSHLGDVGFDDQYDADYSLEEIVAAQPAETYGDFTAAPEPSPRPAREPEPARPPVVAPPPRAADPVDRQSFKIKTHAGYVITDDDDDEEGEFIEPFPIEQVVTHPSAPDAGGKRRVVEVIKVTNAVVTDNGLLQGLNRTYKDGDLHVSMSWEKTTVTYRTEATGTIRLITGETEAIPAHPGRFRLQFGEQATIYRDGSTYMIRSFRPPETPAAVRRKDPKEVLRPFIGAFLISIVWHFFGFGAVMITESMGVSLTIQKSEEVEVFAEGRLEKPKPKPVTKKPKPPPKPKPKKVSRPTEKKADPTEQKPIVPKSVRKRLNKRMKTRPQKADETKAEGLVAALTTPVQGEGETVADTVTNIDAVKTPGQQSALRVAGTIAALEGNEVNIGRGGGGKLGDLTKGVKGGTGKLEKRKSNAKVRGKVNASKALGKVQGSLSKAEVYAVISKHQQAVLRCYEKQLAKKPGLGGKINFEWTVKTNGRVTKAREKSSTLNDATVSKCVLGVIKSMKFPKPKGGEVIIAFPFFFQSK